MAEVTFQFSDKQLEALSYLRDKETCEVLYGGAAGGGKSFLGCYWQITNRLKYPGTRGLIGRSKLKSLKETTLRSFFDVCKQLQLIPGKHYKYNDIKGVVTFHNGSEIILKDLFLYPSDPNFDSLGSLEITDYFVDEASQVSFKAKSILNSRVRYKLEDFGLLPKGLYTCNPALNWVYTDFYDPYVKNELEPNKKFIQALVTDNPFISPFYIENLQRLPEIDKQRLFHGNWQYDDDPARLMDFNKIEDLFTNDHVRSGEKFISADIAFHGSDKFVAMVWDGFKVKKVYTLEKTDAKAVLDFLKMLCQTYSVPRSNIVYDSDGLGSYLRGFLSNSKPFSNNGKPVKVASKQENYANLKTQCYYKLADMVQKGEIYIEPEAFMTKQDRESLTQELLQVKRDRLDDDGKLYLVPKATIKENIKRSPDFADAMMMRMFFNLKNNKIIPFKLPY